MTSPDPGDGSAMRVSMLVDEFPLKMHNDVFFAHAILQGPHLIPRSTSVLMTPRSEQTVRCEQSLVSTAG